MATSRRRRTARRRPVRKGTKWYNRKYSTGELAYRAAKGVWYLKGLVNSELYKFDSALGLQGTNNTGAVWNLMAVPEGDSFQTRTGISIFVKSLYLRLFFNHNTTGGGDQWVNMYIVEDKQQIADIAPTMATLLQNPGLPTTALMPQLAGRFKIWKHEKFVLRPTTPNTKLIEQYIPMRHHVKYNGSAGTDVQKGALYLMVASNMVTNGPQFIADWRVSYHDN